MNEALRASLPQSERDALIAVKKAADRFLIEKSAASEFALATACAKADEFSPVAESVR